MANYWNFCAIYTKERMEELLYGSLWSYEDNRLLQLEAVVI